MRIWIGRAAVLVGVFALVAAAVAVFWGRTAATRMPLNVDARTVLEGTATGQLAEQSASPVPVKYVNVTKADPKASKKAGGNIIVLVQQGCIVVQVDNPPDCPAPTADGTADPRVVDQSLSAYALDRHTGLALKDQGKYVGDKFAQVGMTGLVSKFPFDTKKRDYQYWDGTLGASVTAHYVKERTIQGLTTYEFDVSIPAADNVVLAKGTDGAADTTGTYAASQTIWVEPTTGAYIDQKANQTMSIGDTTLLDIHLGYGKATVAHNVDYANSNRAQLALVKIWIPLGGLVAGLVILLVAAWLLAGGRRKPEGGAGETAEPKVPTPAGV